MKKKKKKKIVKEKIEASRSLKIAMKFFYGGMAFVVLCLILGAVSKKFAIILWRYCMIPMYGFIYSIGQVFVLKIGSFRVGGFLLLLVVYFIIDFISYIIGQSKSLPKEKRHSIYNAIQTVLFYSLGIVSVCIFGGIFWAQNNPKLDTLFFPEKVNNTYQEEDIWNLTDYLEKKVIEYSSLVDRDKNGRIIEQDYVELAHKDLANASKKYWVMRGIYPKKLYYFNDYDLSHDPSTLGLTTVDVVGLSKEQEAPALLNTITHELCHTRGIVRENEATLCSIIAGLESENTLSRYAAYLEAYDRTLDAAYLLDSDRSRVSSHRVQKLCTEKGYDDICNYGFKLTKLYVHKSDTIVLDTFSLDQYSDMTFLEEFMEEVKSYSPKYYINDKKIKAKDVSSYYYQDVTLSIDLKNSKEIFEEVKDLLDSNKEYFRFIGQEYPGMYEGVDMKREEAIKYYTSSIPDSTIITHITQSDKIDELFDYSRVVRLILEYFDAENISYLS